METSRKEMMNMIMVQKNFKKFFIIKKAVTSIKKTNRSKDFLGFNTENVIFVEFKI